MDAFYRAVHRYCLEHTTPPEQLFHELERETHLKTLAPQMLSGPLQGQFLRMISLLMRPERILEIGTFTGYAALCLAAGLAPGGHLDTIEANRELAYLIRKYFARAPQAQQLYLHLGKAEEILPQLPDNYQLAFIDAGKRANAAFYEQVVPKLSPGGVLLIDNVLWSGKVVTGATDPDTKSIMAFNEHVGRDTRVQNIMLPLRDGLLMVRKL